MSDMADDLFDGCLGAHVGTADLRAVDEDGLVGTGGEGVQRHLDGVERGVAPHVADERAAQPVGQAELGGEQHVG